MLGVLVFECALPALVEVVTFRSKNSSSTCMEGAAGKFIQELLLSFCCPISLLLLYRVL